VEVMRLNPSIPLLSSLCSFQYMATLHQTDLKKTILCQRLSRDNSQSLSADAGCQGQPIVVNREQIEQEVNNLAKTGVMRGSFYKKPV